MIMAGFSVLIHHVYGYILGLENDFENGEKIV